MVGDPRGLVADGTGLRRIRTPRGVLGDPGGERQGREPADEVGLMARIFMSFSIDVELEGDEPSTVGRTGELDLDPGG